MNNDLVKNIINTALTTKEAREKFVQKINNTYNKLTKNQACKGHYSKLIRDVINEDIMEAGDDELQVYNLNIDQKNRLLHLLVHMWIDAKIFEFCKYHRTFMSTTQWWYRSVCIATHNNAPTMCWWIQIDCSHWFFNKKWDMQNKPEKVFTRKKRNKI